MNPFMMPLEERKRREFHSFAKLCVYAITFGLCLAAFIYATKWGF